MNFRNVSWLSITVLISYCLFAAPVLADDSDDIATIADILIHMEHYPDNAAKQKLENIVKNKSANKDIKELASVLGGLSHYLSDTDRKRLQTLSTSKTVDLDVKDIAKVLLNIKHKASDKQKARLKAYLK